MERSPTAVGCRDPKPRTHGAATANAARRSTTPDKLSRSAARRSRHDRGKALKKNPQERYGSVTALADDLSRYLRHEPISARPDTLAYRAGKFVRRNRRAVALVDVGVGRYSRRLAGTMIQAEDGSRPT